MEKGTYQRCVVIKSNARTLKKRSDTGVMNVPKLSLDIIGNRVQSAKLSEC